MSLIDPGPGPSHRKNVRRIQQIQQLCRSRKKVLSLVYQMGRVGSTAVRDALIKAGVSPVFRIHFLDSNNLSLFFPSGFSMEHPEVRQDFNLHREWSGLLSDCVTSRACPLRIITMVREPVSRNISMFFDRLSSHLPLGTDLRECRVEEVKAMFLNHARHEVPGIWFDREMKQMLKIDVYAHSFPREKGFLHIRENGIDLLIMKNEISDNIKESVLRRFMKVPGVSIHRRNTASCRSHAGLYHSFIKRVHLPEQYVNEMLSTPYVRHFYTDREIENARNRWLSPQPGEKDDRKKYGNIFT